jgi:hypothetical protein
MFTLSVFGNQLRTAIDAEGTLLPACGRVVDVAAGLHPDTFVDDATTGRTMPHGGMLTSMIQIVARCSSHARPYHIWPLFQPAQSHKAPVAARTLRPRPGLLADNR